MDVPVLAAAVVALVALVVGLVVGALLVRGSRAGATSAAAADAAARTALDLERRQVAVAGLVAPLTDGLQRLEGQLGRLETDRARTEAGLGAQLRLLAETSEDLRHETSALVTALRAPHVRGRWGEQQLERTVEAAGMLRHVDFDTQVSARADGDATLRPDMVVRLVGGKHVVVDAKVPLAAYLEALEARDDAARDERLQAHARQLRRHIDALAARRYPERFAPAPEFVVCFVPADPVLDAALRADPSLQEHAFGCGVVLATPSTLVALLRTVAYTWRQDALAREAREVHALGRDLHQRLATMAGHVDRLGRSLTTAVENYNQTVASLESRVLVTARRLRDHGVVDPADPATALRRPGRVDAVARSPAPSEPPEPPEPPEPAVAAEPPERDDDRPPTDDVDPDAEFAAHR